MATVIDIDKVTDGSVSGDGSFDRLAKAMSNHIQQEYDAGRITGSDYANVYLGGIQSAMAQSVQFELNRTLAAANTDTILERGGFR
jgi:hypothetical protein